MSWKCPYCNHYATLSDGNDVYHESNRLQIENAEGFKEFTFEFIVCPNTDCKRFTLTAFLFETALHSDPPRWVQGKLIKRWNLIPESKAQTFPDYIPKAIRDDYNEACLIQDQSPKASATLSRRCIQGIIRDFWGISKSRLIDEIEAIKDKVDPATWAAIDSVRKIGNIGAHMERDINVIVDVEPNEAELLINLIEILIKDWYIDRENKRNRLEAIKKLAEDKDNKKKEASAVIKAE